MNLSVSNSSPAMAERVESADRAERTGRTGHAVRVEPDAWPTPAPEVWRSLRALIARSIVRARLMFGMVCALLTLFQVALVVQATSQFEAQAFGRMAELVPAFLRRTLGDLTFAILSFQGVVTAAYFHPVIVLLIAHLAVYLATEPADDVEAGRVDLLLARPVPRHALISRSLALVVLAAILVTATLALAMQVALHLFAPSGAPWPTVRLVLAMSAGLAAVTICFGALALAIAARARRRGTAMAVASVMTVLLYLIVFLEPTWTPAHAVGWLSPFHYFHPIGMLAGRADLWRDLLVLGVSAAGLSSIAYWTFTRRDL